MKIKQLIPKILLVIGLAFTIMVAGPSRVLCADKEFNLPQGHTTALTDDKGNFIGKVTQTPGPAGTRITTYVYDAGPKAGTTQITKDAATGQYVISDYIKNPDGSSVYKENNFSKGGITLVTTDKSGVATTITEDISGKIVSKTIQSTSPNGKVTTQTIDPVTDKPTGLSIKDSKGNVTTAMPDGKGGFYSAVRDKNGQVATTSYDANGKPTSETTKDKNGKLISSTSITYDAKGGSTSVTTDKNGKIVSSTVYDKLGNVVTQTGKPKGFAAVGPGSPGSAVTPPSAGSVKHKDKEHFQSEVFHKPEDKSMNQNFSAPSGLSGSNQSQHHGKR